MCDSPVQHLSMDCEYYGLYPKGSIDPIIPRYTLEPSGPPPILRLPPIRSAFRSIKRPSIINDTDPLEPPAKRPVPNEIYFRLVEVSSTNSDI